MRADDMSAHTSVEYQVWVATAEGRPLYLYRGNLGLAWIAQEWADGWNANRPADVMPGSRFVVVTATTSYRTSPVEGGIDT